MEGLGARAIQHCMLAMRVLRERTQANLFGREVLCLLQICESAQTVGVGLPSRLNFEDYAAVVRSGALQEFVPVCPIAFKRCLVYFERLAQ